MSDESLHRNKNITKKKDKSANIKRRTLMARLAMHSRSTHVEGLIQRYYKASVRGVRSGPVRSGSKLQMLPHHLGSFPRLGSRCHRPSLLQCTTASP